MVLPYQNRMWSEILRKLFFFHEMLKMKKTRIKCIKLRLKAPAPSSTREFYKYYHFMFIPIDSHFQRHTHTHPPQKHFYRMLSSTSFCSFSSFFLILWFGSRISSDWVSERMSRCVCVQIILIIRQKSIEHKNININYKSININKRTNGKSE